MLAREEHHCDRCGGTLPVITVRVLRPQGEGLKPLGPADPIGEYVEREELGECVRCTGGY